MTTGYWARTFRVLSYKATIGTVGITLLSGAVPPDSASIAAISQLYRASPTAETRLKLLSYAKLHAKDQGGAMANFALGATAFDQKNFLDAMQYIKAAQPLLPKLADYTGFYIASAEAELSDFPSAIQELALLPGSDLPMSPLAAKIKLLEGQALIKTRLFNDAIKTLRANFEKLAQPDADVALAQAYEGQGELAQAAVLYQRVYFTRPATKLAVDAAAAIERLKQAMGKAYPPAMPPYILTRGDQWMAIKQYAKARQEFHDMQTQLGGMEREQAMVRIGAADLASGNAAGAYKYLKELKLARSEAGAERDYYLEEAARKAGTQSAGAVEALQDLEKHYPDSPWRLKTLVAAGNGYLAAHQPENYTPLFRAAYEKFPADSTTAYCHWRVAWDAYLMSRSEARDLMREQLQKYPEDQRSASALYYLGRLAEGSQDFAGARAFYEQLQGKYPHYYYGTLGATRLADAKLVSAKAAPEVSQWLSSIAFPPSPDFKVEDATTATKAHVERARILASGGFSDWAATEMRFGAANDGQRHLLAIELARSDATVALSLRHMKSLAPEYLSLDYKQAPRELWGYLFPLPYQETLLKDAKERDLDPYLVAGLIRQESEFNPEALSRARAMGLTQLMPATGSMMARQAGMLAFQTKMLLDPQVSLKLGMQYLKMQLDQWNGNLEQTLAAYNAGPGRVKQWIAGTAFREPAEFVESIPFTETREYVQSVLRNAAIYRQLYTSKTPPPQPGNALTSTHADGPRSTANGPRKPGIAAKSTVKRKSSSAVQKRAE